MYIVCHVTKAKLQIAASAMSCVNVMHINHKLHKKKINLKQAIKHTYMNH